MLRVGARGAEGSLFRRKLEFTGVREKWEITDGVRGRKLLEMENWVD